MFYLLESVSEAVYDLIRWKLNFKIIVTGVVISAIWALLGWLMWPFLYGMASHVLTFLPFAMLRSDGAYFFIAMVWALGTMVTFALVMMFFGEFFAKKIKAEYYTRFLPMLIVGITLLWAFIVFAMFDKLYAIFLRIFTTLPFEYTEEGVAAIIVLYLLYNGIVVTLAAVSGVQIKSNLESLRAEKYADESVLGDKQATALETAKDIGIFIVASIVLFPLLFIPVINMLVQLGLYIWLFKDLFGRDVCALYCNQEEENVVKKYKAESWMVAILASLMSFIPFVNFFAPYFGEVATFHFVMKVKDLKED